MMIILYQNIHQKSIKAVEIFIIKQTFALFTNAKILNKNASAILTVTDNLVTKEKLSSEEREQSTIKMIELVLDSALNL